MRPGPNLLHSVKCQQCHRKAISASLSSVIHPVSKPQVKVFVYHTTWSCTRQLWAGTREEIPCQLEEQSVCVNTLHLTKDHASSFTEVYINSSVLCECDSGIYCKELFWQGWGSVICGWFEQYKWQQNTSAVAGIDAHFGNCEQGRF